MRSAGERELLRSRRAPLLALALVALAAAIWLASLDSHLTFVGDDWDFLVRRQGASPSVFLDPFNGNIAIGPALVFKLGLALFGMDSALPFYLVAIALFLASGLLLFLHLRRRVGDWLALIGAVSILFLGAAFEVVLWISPINFVGSMLAGLGMLLALDREDRRGDRVACVLLIASIAFSSLGLAFAAGALADLLLGRRPRARRAYVALLPIALYGFWWAGWGHAAHSYVSLRTLEHTPQFVFDAAAAGIVSLLGLATGDGSEPSQPHLIWGQLLLVPLLALLALHLHRRRRLSHGLAVALAIGLAFWFLAGLNRTPERFPASSRYQYSSAVFLLLIAAEALRGLRIPKLAVLGTAVVAGLGVVGGIGLLHREYSERWHPAAGSLRSYLASLRIAADSLEPRFPVEFPPTTTVLAGAYLTAAREHGSPAYTEAELAGRPQAERAGADLTIARAESLVLAEPDRWQRRIACRALPASSSASTGVTMREGDYGIRNLSGANVEVLLGRFADGFSVDLGPLAAGETTALRVPPDGSSRPWRLGLRGAGAVRLCAAAAAGGR